MSSETHPRPDSDFARGLPPVTPPSGKFIVQLFLVPGLIVAGILAVLVPFVVWQTRPYRADVLLEDLRSANADVRWRAAERLSKVLPYDCAEPSPRYALDVKFALDLSEELRNAINEEGDIVARIANKTKEEAPKEYKALETQQDLIRFLCSGVGFFDVPVSAPVLCEIALSQGRADDKVIKERRYRAVIALANLGDNVKYFQMQPEEKRQQVLEQLESEAAKTSDRGKWAKAALNSLKNDDSISVDAALARCAKSEDLYFRLLSAAAMAHWEGPEGEAALVDLVHDDGHGAEPEQQRLYQEELKFQAVGALARRGSKLFDTNPNFFDILAEMLDEKMLREHFRTKINDKEVVDEKKVRGTIENAVRALVELHKKRPELDVSRFDPLLEKVADTSTESLRSLKKEVEEARENLSKPT
jgi:hypothetical protein